MKTREITICGKHVNIAYCYATEIGFNDIAGVNIDKFNPNEPTHILALISAAIICCYKAKDEESPIDIGRLMYDAEPDEIAQAITAITQLRIEWYKLPAGETTDKNNDKKEDDEKNA